MQKKLYLLTLGLVLLPYTLAFAQYTNGQSADLVLGQPDFTSTTDLVAADRMTFPYGLAINPISGKVYVSDGGNNRVVRFPAEPVNSMNAEAVLGQTDFVSTANDVTDSKFNYSSGVSIDSAGNLWVADYYNARVLKFSAVDSKSNGAAANTVIGQPNFTTNTQLCTDSRIGRMEGIHIDHNGTLWITDFTNNRVLWFNNAATLSNGAPANGVLGQNNFTNFNSGTSATAFNYPSGVFADQDGFVWVTDYHNNRVLRFDNAQSLTNGASASAVLGQANFTSNLVATSASGFNGPYRSAVDKMGTLWVAEYSSNRILGFFNAADKSNGAAADIVLGQVNFTDSLCGASETKICGPIDVAIDDNGRVYVTDYNNSRIIRYSPAITQPDASVSYGGKRKGKNVFNSTAKKQTLLINLAKGQKSIRINFNIKNTSETDNGGFRLKGSKFNKKSFRVKYFYKGKNITNKINSGNFYLANLSPETTAKIKAKATTHSEDSAFTKRIKLTAYAAYDDALVDATAAKVVR
jgi:sugar lactone lactonase YvrE